MTADLAPENALITADVIAETVLLFLEDKTKLPVKFDQDIFSSGLVSSIFAMELIAHLEIHSISISRERHEAR
jgi:methoxymalonate biosynthesis acyl carrier protein